MRLIDADALEQTFRRWLAAKDYNESERHIMRAAIIECQDAPTVQPDAPRVMTLEEAKYALKNDVVIWCETQEDDRVIAALKIDGSKYFTTQTDELLAEDEFDSDNTAAAYGSIIRIWTSRPTDEQRKAVKWDETQ